MTTATKQTLTTEQVDNLHNEMKRHFVSGMAYAGIKAKSAKYKAAEADFYCGAMAALSAIGVHGNQAMPPLWVFSILRGDSIIDQPHG